MKNIQIGSNYFTKIMDALKDSSSWPKEINLQNLIEIKNINQLKLEKDI